MLLLDGFTCRLMPESIPWLAANGREEDAEKILRSAGRASGIHFPEIILHREEDDKPSSSVGKVCLSVKPLLTLVSIELVSGLHKRRHFFLNTVLINHCGQ